MVPSRWSDKERNLYVSIGERKKSEHVLGYSVVSVGVQLFHHITSISSLCNKEETRQEELGSCSGSCDHHNVQQGDGSKPDGDAQESGNAAQTD